MFHNFDTRTQCYKTFYASNVQIFVINGSICPWQAFQALSYVRRWSQEPTLDDNTLKDVPLGFNLTHKHKAGLEKLANDKLFSLQQKFINYWQFL